LINVCGTYYSIPILLILCFSGLKTRILSIIFFTHDNSPYHVEKVKKATTLRQCPNALSALEVFTMRTFQHQWALGVINATCSHLMLMQSRDLEVEDDDDLFMVLYHHHRSI